MPRVEHPSCFVMSAVSGPLKVPGLDVDARGAFPRPHKYLFVAKVRIPRTFVDDGRGTFVDYDPGELEVDDNKDQGTFDYVEGDEEEQAVGVPEAEPVQADEDDDGDVRADKRDPHRHEEDSDLAGQTWLTSCLQWRCQITKEQQCWRQSRTSSCTVTP